MFGITALCDKMSDIGKTLVKVLASQLTIQSRIAVLESTMKHDREADRKFMLDIVKMLHATRPVPAPMLVSPSFDPFTELPLGHRDGYKNEELGVYDSPEVES